ncbi:pyridoxamine 5'-phosphate oxidase family protein [Nocardia paucivorans]|uniref:pyridoxamine 5'-phosphate oxidase family protein n=1 Tax=Nocardia paucivorans TaxID=114259 RepID=UPI000303E3D4|nr:pyridoxamine 5'-phosphate oxidase family protein [Nocardia paucivorans]
MDERALLEEYVAGGKLMQLSTIDADGAPRVCSVWYLAEFRPDRLWFVSRQDREHSRNIRRNPLVAGAIMDIPLHELGQTARGVSFSGRAHELPGSGVNDRAKAFVARWPNAAPVLDAMPEGASRLYEITVGEWVLFDEENFRRDPRRVIPGR